MKYSIDRKILKSIYRKLLYHFGKQHWWPANSIDEIIIGAILAQNTSWENVKKAIDKLKENNCLNMREILKLRKNKLKILIKSAGFFERKSIYLKEMAKFCAQFDFNYKKISKIPNLRERLLNIKGIGNETADTLMLYAFNRAEFVIDAYTIRVFKRHFKNFPDNYNDAKDLFEHNLKRDVKMFNEYHALIVMLAKTYCKKQRRCKNCPLEDFSFF